MTSFYASGVQLGAVKVLASYAIAYKLAQLLTQKEKELTSQVGMG